MENYNEIKDALKYEEVFKGNSCFATSTGSGYVVYSYKTLMFEKTPYSIYFNYKNYSKNTGRIQNLILDNIQLFNQTLKEYLQAYFKLNKLDREEYNINL